jgi:hypothetical protein
MAAQMLVNGIDVRAVMEQLNMLGHSVTKDTVISFLQELRLDGGCVGVLARGDPCWGCLHMHRADTQGSERCIY